MEDVTKIITPCFNCNYCYTCKYYQNPVWCWWIYTRPEDGCPAVKYQFESIFQEFARLKEQKKGCYANRR